MLAAANQPEKKLKFPTSNHERTSDIRGRFCERSVRALHERANDRAHRRNSSRISQVYKKSRCKKTSEFSFIQICQASL